MFTPEVIRSRLRGPHFRPVRVVASEGLRYDIYHPDLVLVGEYDVMIGLPSSKPGIYSDVARVAILHIVALEDLPVPAGSGNGQQQQ